MKIKKASFLKKVAALSTATVVSLSVFDGNVVRADDTNVKTISEDITIETESTLPSKISENSVKGYSFVKELSAENWSESSVFTQSEAAMFNYDDSMNYEIPWIVSDFPTTAYSPYPVEYSYYQTTDGTPLYCIDFNKAAPVSGIDSSYELSLVTDAFSKDATVNSESTMMLAPLLYGYPNVDMDDLTAAEWRWTTSLAFKLISGRVYDAASEDYSIYGLCADDFWTDSFYSKYNSSLSIDTITGIVGGSSKFGGSSDNWAVSYDDLDGYEGDTSNVNSVQLALYTILRGAYEINKDDGNYERTMLISYNSSMEESTITTTIYIDDFGDPPDVPDPTICLTAVYKYTGPYTINVNQGNLYSSEDGSTITGSVLAGDIINISTGKADTMVLTDLDDIEDPNFNYTKTANYLKDYTYAVPVNTEFYVVTYIGTEKYTLGELTESEAAANVMSSYKGETISLSMESQTIGNVENAYYCGKNANGVATQRLLLCKNTPLQGAFVITLAAGEEETETGSIRILKTNSITGATLEGAVFDVYDNESCTGDAVGTITTDEDGKGLLEGLEYGTYYLVESKAPEGYNLADEVVEIEVNAESESTAKYTTIKNEPLGSITILKTDETSGESLPGAEFEISALADIVFNGVKYSTGDVIATIVSDDDGVAKLEGLPTGKYSISEIKAPSGYVVNDEDVTVTISSGSLKQLYMSIEICNTAEETPTGKIKIIKVDSTDNTKVISDVVFDIYDEDDTFVESVTTNDSGIAISGELSLGTYVIKEVKTASGYLLNEEDITVILDESDKVDEEIIHTTIIENTPVEDTPETGRIKIIKVDSADNTKVISDVVFDIYDEDDTFVESVTTNDSGVAISSKLPLGTYTIKEVKTASGYLLNEEDITVILDESDKVDEEIIHTTIIENTPVEDTPETGRIKIIKVDSADNTKVISDVVFDIYDEDNAFIESVTTNDSGVAISSKLPLGIYTIKEVKTASGYLLNDEDVTVVLNESDKVDEKIIHTTIIENTPKQGRIRVIKIDADNNEILLSGAVFNVYNNDGSLVDTITTGVNGTAITDTLPLGDYTVVEVTAPENYVLSDSVYNASLNDSGNNSSIVYTTLTVKNEKEETISYQKGKIQLNKVDESGNTLSGAVFKIVAAENIYEDELVYSLGDIVQTLTTSDNGQAVSELLPLGKYNVTETSAPTGYYLDTTTYTVTLSADESKEIPIKTITVLNQSKGESTPYYGYIEIIKRDIKDRSVMEDVKFNIYAAADIIVDETVVYKENELVETITTDFTGSAVSSGLPVGKYYVKEKGIVDGYIKNVKKYSVIISENSSSKVVSKTIYNTPTEVVITKTDITNSAPVIGATIEICDEDGKLVFEDTTDSTGKITAMYLPIGKYTFTETVAPDGYILNKTEFEFEIADDGEVNGTTTFTNAPTEVVINKTDLTTGQPLPGATIEIKDQFGNVVYTDVTDDNGNIKAMRLNPGIYTFTETAAPDGYVREPESFTFVIYPDGTVMGNCTITNKPTEVVLTKKDLTTGQPLPGATIDIMDKDGNIVFTGISDENGEVSVFKLVPGVYTFTETSAPDGYTINKESFTFTLNDDGSVVGDTTITDTVTEVTITKRDITDSSPLPGATIQILTKDKTLVFEGVTGDDGTVTAFKLTPGEYILKEISAPDGYTLNEESMEFILNEDGSISGSTTIYDTPQERTEIKTGVEPTSPANNTVLPIVLIVVSLSVVELITCRKLAKY